MQRVLLTIKGTQMEGGSNELIEFVTEGRFCKLSDGCLLEYDESALTGIDGCTTTLTLKNGSVTLQRSGLLETQIIFSPGSVYQGHYTTPHGNLDISVYAVRIKSHLGDNDGSLSLEYELNLGDLVSVNKLDLSFKQMRDCIS